MNSGGGGGDGGGGGGGRVPIPKKLKKMIQDIKEIAGGKHSDEDIYTMLKECNMDPNDTAQRLLYLDTFHEVRRKRDKKKVDVGRTSDDYRWSSSMQHRGARGGRESYPSSNVSEDFGGRRKGNSRQENGFSNYRGGSVRVPTRVVQKRNANAVTSVSSGPKNPSNGHSYDTASQVSCGNITISSNSPAPLCADISDTIVVQPMRPHVPGTVEKMECESGTRGSVTESSSVQNEAKMGASREVEKNFPIASDTMNLSSKVAPSITQAFNSYPLPEPPNETDDTLVVQNNQKLENLSVSSHQPVIFPDHLQVPEVLRRGLTFGSLDATLDHSVNSDNVPVPMNENSSVADLVGEEPSKSSHHAPPTMKEGDNSLCPPSHPQMSGTLSSLGDDESSTGGQKFDQSKQDSLGPVPQMALLQTAPEYGYGIMPPVITPHTTHLEGTETQVSNRTVPSASGSIPPVTQPSGLGQNSFALPPHLLPYLRQPYAPNLIPYNPYFSHPYMPHTAHQYLGHNILPQQPTTGNVYASPAAAAGSKYAVSPILKTSSFSGNMTHLGVPSGYGSFGASHFGYSLAPAFTSGSSNSTEDLMAAEFNESNGYPAALKENEEGHTRTTTIGRDLSTLPTNYFYNIPPGHHVAFPHPHTTHGPPFPGVHHFNQAHPLPSSSSVQSISHQPQAAGGTIDSVVHPSQLPHSQINWNSKLLNKDNL